MRVAGVFVWLAAFGCSVAAQSVTAQLDSPTPPTIGGSGGINPAQKPRVFGSSGVTEILRHRDFAGKACLTIEGSARPHAIVSNLYDHVITAINKCPQRISIQVCYYKSQDCEQVEIPGNERKQVILGTLPVKDFRFEFREKF